MHFLKSLRSLGLAILCAAAIAAARAAAPQDAPQSLYDGLLKAMKDGPSLGFAGRKAALGPVVQQALNLPLMARLAVGPAWRNFTPDQKTAFVQAFTDYSVGVYASRFASFGGERFEVSADTTKRASGDVVVHTQLVPKGGDPVKLDYLVRDFSGQYQAIDIFLNGTISQLATERSEYSATVQNGGADALIKLLQQKSAALR